MLAKFHSVTLKNMHVMHESIQLPSGMNNVKMAHLYPLGTFSAFCYMFNVFSVAITLNLFKVSS